MDISQFETRNSCPFDTTKFDGNYGAVTSGVTPNNEILYNNINVRH